MLLILIGLVAAAGAAPHFPFSDETSQESIFNDEIFNMNSFWKQFNREMATLERSLSEMSRNLPNVATKEGIQGNEYVIEIPLTGFQESDISVKARQGLLKIVAQHSIGSGSINSFVIVRSLPNFVGTNGDWTYENDILKIVFPMNKRTSEGTTRPAPNRSREEIETDNADINTNADIGLDRSEDIDLKTNEIPTKNPIEQTTYSEGHENEYEFVPLSKY